MLSDKSIVLLVGGVGGAKLAYGLYHMLNPKNLTVIVNTGDDFWLYGLRICPDLDTITYTLSDLVNKETGWGVGGDTFHTLDALNQIGDTPWFRLGDRDLATHMLRTQMWHEGQPLTAITERIASTLEIGCTIVPMADTPVETIVETQEYGELAFQEYFVRRRWQPTVQALHFRGAQDASITDAVRDAVSDADAIIVGPSNPWLSIQPILRVPGLRDLLRSRDVPRVAVTPIVGGQAVKGPTAKIMREFGLEVSAQTVIEYYGDLINGFIYDQQDQIAPAPGVRILAADTLMTTDDKRIALAQRLLSWLKDWGN